MKKHAALFVKTAVSIGIISTAAMLTKSPMLMPPLGATSFLCFFSPNAPSSKISNTIAGHTIAIACGFIALLVCGLLDAGATSTAGYCTERVIAISLALGLTCAGMSATNFIHPPAGATTLVVSMGLLTTLPQFLAFEGGVLLLATSAWVLNQFTLPEKP